MDTPEAMDSCKYAIQGLYSDFPQEITFNLKNLMIFIC